MPSVEVKTINLSSSIVLECSPHDFRDALLAFAGAGTVLAGTILARRTSDLRVVPFVVGGTGGAETPVAVLTYDVVATGAGDVAIRMMVSGKVNRNRLIIAADGHGNNLTPAHMDALRHFGIVPVDVQALASSY